MRIIKLALQNLFTRRFTRKKELKVFPEWRGRYEIDKKKCIKCGLCMKYCPAFAIKDFKIIQDRCVKCGLCAFLCPVKAIQVKHELEA